MPVSWGSFSEGPGMSNRKTHISISVPSRFSSPTQELPSLALNDSFWFCPLEKISSSFHLCEITRLGGGALSPAVGETAFPADDSQCLRWRLELGMRLGSPHIQGRAAVSKHAWACREAACNPSVKIPAPRHENTAPPADLLKPHRPWSPGSEQTLGPVNPAKPEACPPHMQAGVSHLKPQEMPPDTLSASPASKKKLASIYERPCLWF